MAGRSSLSDNNTFAIWSRVAAGNRSRRTDYNGAISNYSYDALNRLATISYPDSTSATFFMQDTSSEMRIKTRAAATFG